MERLDLLVVAAGGPHGTAPVPLGEAVEGPGDLASGVALGGLRVVDGGVRGHRGLTLG